MARPTAPASRSAVGSALDWAFFVFAGVAAIWLSVLVAQASLGLGWGELWFAVVYWALLAYLVLPRLHRILTSIYVPDYFIGRARTSDGLLGDPVNVAFLGGEAQLHRAVSAAGWIRADDLSVTAELRIVRSTLLRRSYPEAPVSPLLLFGRTQDFAYQQEVDGTPGKRHHVRFWRCPEGWRLPGGREADWLAAGTYDRSVGFSLFTLQVTHKIAPHTDTERDHIVATVEAAVPAASTSVIRDFSTGYHARNGGGDSISTDGDLPVVDLRATGGSATHLPPTDSRDRRPAPTVVGAVLVTVRGLFAGLVLLIAVLSRDEVVAAISRAVPGLSAEAAGAAHIAVVVVLGALTAFELLVAWRILLGGNGARVLAMSVSSVAIVVQALALVAGGADITVRTNLVGLSLDILLLLALSSHRARTYALRPRTTPKRISGRPGDAAAF
jgi:hypothetical protein